MFLRVATTHHTQTTQIRVAGAYGRASNVFDTRAALYPLPTRSLRSFVEEGALAPQFR